MLKKFLTMLCFSFLFLLTSCGGGDASETPSVDAKSPIPQVKSEAAKASSGSEGSGMSEAAILKDLNTHQEFFDCFGPNAGYAADTIEINQRTTTKDKSDTIYANITAVNDVSSYCAEFHMHYTYYEQGGWRLDTLEQSGDGTYYISFWPDEADACSVWENNYAERFYDEDDNGAYDYVLDKCEVVDSGDNYVSFFITYGTIGHVHTKYEVAQLDFTFNQGQWTHSASYYPAVPVWKLSEGIEGTFHQTSITDDSVAVFIGNIYYYDSGIFGDSGIYGDWFKYVYFPETGQAEMTSEMMRSCTSWLDSLRFFNSSKGLAYHDAVGLVGGDLGVPLEYQSKSPNTPLTEEDAKGMIKRIVEAAGFTYREEQSGFGEEVEYGQEISGQSEPTSGTELIDEAYPYLREFVDLAYSDPSDIESEDEEEYNAFIRVAKADYDRWAAGTDYHYIVIDSTGHLAIDYDIAEAEGIVGLW